MSISNNVIELNIKQGYTSPIIASFSVVQFDTLNSFEFRVMDGFRSVDYRNFERVDLEIVQGFNTPRVIQNIRINENSFSYNVQAGDFTETGKTVLRLRLRDYNNLTVTTNSVRFNVISSDFDTGMVFPNMDNYVTREVFESHLADNQRHTTLEEKQSVERAITENKVNIERNKEKLSSHEEDIAVNTAKSQSNGIRISTNEEDISNLLALAELNRVTIERLTERVVVLESTIS